MYPSIANSYESCAQHQSNNGYLFRSCNRGLGQMLILQIVGASYQQIYSIFPILHPEVMVIHYDNICHCCCLS